MQDNSITPIAGHDEFRDRAVIVIGGYQGSGPTVIRSLIERGAKVAIGVTGVESQPPELGSVPAHELDMNDEQSIRAFFDQCEAELGGLDVLVMMAAPVHSGAALDTPAERYRQVVEHELLGPILCIKEAAARMKSRGNGRIISFASMSGKTGVHRNVAPYAAAKGGLIAFSRSLAADIAPYGVTVNVIATALFDVQVAVLDDEERKEIAKGIPVGRPGHSEEAAHAVLYLASRLGAFVTGETLNLSGGRFMD